MRTNRKSFEHLLLMAIQYRMAVIEPEVRLKSSVSRRLYLFSSLRYKINDVQLGS
jgi:hypothetical protein